MLIDIENKKILKDSKYSNLFLSASLNEIKEDCKILKSNFYLDSFNYFPITKNYETFKELFKRQDNNSIENFYTETFFKGLKNNINNFKNINDCFILGSSPADNFYSNLIHFLPRIFFVDDKQINLLIHRNSSNKLRNLITNICHMRDIEVKFIYIDHEFCNFSNSNFPQFFKIEKSVKILKFFFQKILAGIQDLDFSKKIYVRRENSTYRKVLNEADLIQKLRKNNFDIINPNHFSILEQMKIFSKADVIISPHGSNLSNIIFSKNGTKVFEIGPKFDKSYEINLQNRYKQLSNITELQYTKLEVDSVNVESHSALATKYITKKILDESNYYKNLIVKVNEIDKILESI